MKIQLKYGFEAAVLSSHHKSFATIVMQALGGKAKTKDTGTIRDPSYKDVTAGAPNVEQAVLAMNRMLSF